CYALTAPLILFLQESTSERGSDTQQGEEVVRNAHRAELLRIPVSRKRGGRLQYGGKPVARLARAPPFEKVAGVCWKAGVNIADLFHDFAHYNQLLRRIVRQGAQYHVVHE